MPNEPARPPSKETTKPNDGVDKKEGNGLDKGSH
jgi:hypothetical protein